jgi:sugar transferase (PEP-CTERM/EpsH1 system associated)
VRVLFLTHRVPYAPNRGDRTRAYHILRQLAREAEVDLVSLAHDQNEEASAAEIERYVSTLTLARIRRPHQIRRSCKALVSRTPLTHALLAAPGLAATLADLVSRRRPDVVLAYCSGMARIAMEPPLNSVPFVHDMVDVDSEKWRALSERTNGPLKWVYRREARRLADFERTVAERAAVTLLVNERERRALGQIAPAARVGVLGNGVDQVSLRPSTPPVDEPRVVFCGVMNYPPNEAAAIWLAREVWPLVTGAYPSARLLLVGAHPPRAVRRLGRHGTGIEVTGTVPDVRGYLWRSAVAVAPLSVARGVQTKVVEAVAAGLPCVITPPVQGGLPRTVLPACLVGDDAASVAIHVVTLLRMTPIERRLFAARADLRELGWESQLAPLLGILEAAAERRSDFVKPIVA